MELQPGYKIRPAYSIIYNLQGMEKKTDLLEVKMAVETIETSTYYSVYSLPNLIKLAVFLKLKVI